MSAQIIKVAIFLMCQYIVGFLLTFTIYFGAGFPVIERLKIAFDIFLGPVGLVFYSALDNEYTSSVIWLAVFSIPILLIKRFFFNSKQLFWSISFVFWLGSGVFSVLLFIS